MKINRNIFWTETFVKVLEKNNVRYCCISPGSRSTPLTYAFAKSKKIKTFVHIDERSCAFFALGLAKYSNSPVALISTSGTATAEFYPAIIEAYYSRVPLIICTADRPPELLNVGANQTINQNNIYKNHIRKFFDAGLPEVNEVKLKHIKSLAVRAVFECSIKSKGPVHINFPFRKPFEPDSFTDNVNKKIIELANEIDEHSTINKTSKRNSKKYFDKIVEYLKKYEKGIIICGPDKQDKKFEESITNLAQILNYPILADGASQLRYQNKNENIIFNYDSFLSSEKFIRKYQPEIVLHFNKTFTSKILNKYLDETKPKRFMINEFGDWNDPSNNSVASIKYDTAEFCDQLAASINKNLKRNDDWLSVFIEADKSSEKIKNEIIGKSKFPSESRIILELLKSIPPKTNLMISNSMPVRDFDSFASNTNKELKIFSNRGASGIDGINSTALGIAALSKSPTILVTGDLAFYHDLNGLISASKYNIHLTVILINNNGGGIFENLPIASQKKFFYEFFITPHNLDFSGFVKSYKGKYVPIKNWKQLRVEIQNSNRNKKLTVLEILTDAKNSIKIRNKFRQEVQSKIR